MLCNGKIQLDKIHNLLLTFIQDIRYGNLNKCIYVFTKFQDHEKYTNIFFGILFLISYTTIYLKVLWTSEITKVVSIDISYVTIKSNYVIKIKTQNSFCQKSAPIIALEKLFTKRIRHRWYIFF